MLRILGTVVIVFGVALAPALADQGKGKGKAKGAADGGNSAGSTSTVIDKAAEAVVGAVLSDQEKKTIRDYFTRNPESAGKVKPLPPGISKKLARGGTLPPGIAKQALPGNLLRQLPQRDSEDYEIVGTDVVLVDVAKDIIVDVLKDVLRGG